GGWGRGWSAQVRVPLRNLALRGDLLAAGVGRTMDARDAGLASGANSLSRPDSFPRGGSREHGSLEPERPSVDYRLAQFEARQRRLWRFTYLILSLLAIAYVLVSWETIRAFARRYEFLLPALLAVIAAFIVYAWRRNKEIAELRGLVRGIEQRSDAPPSDGQMDKLFSVIERSQQGYRDLIDSFDDVLIAVNLD